MKLVVAEKPSVANEIAKVLGANRRNAGFLEGNGYYVSWCIGHLIEAAMPEDYDEKLKKWELETLPFFPSTWKFKISKSTKTQYDTLKQLMNKSEVNEIICATDSGREGELIFRLVYNQTSCNKPFKRLWISSMEEKAIREGFNKLKDGKEYDDLYHSALARLQADYLVGINISRLFSCLYNKPLNIGRVQTPTINLIVERQRAIENFKPQPYFVLQADCNGFKATKKTEDEAEAQEIIKRCNGKTAIVTSLTTKPVKENASALYDLTTLQREANKMLGLSAQQTLSATQALYEKKLVTYPRTDSRYITNDMMDSTRKVIHDIMNLSIINSKTLDIYDVQKVNVERLANDNKVTDHHGILPTCKVNSIPADLSMNEKSILLLIIYKLLTAAYIPHEYIKTEIVVTIENEDFKATGKQLTEMGFKEVEKHLIELLKATEENLDKNDSENASIPSLTEGQIIENVAVNADKKLTTPPKPYTEDTLLSAMENVMRTLEDEELKKEVGSLGLGTPATRAGIIERIIKTGFIERKKKTLLPTEKAYALIDVVPDKIKSAELTAEWEKQLDEVYQGSINSKYFISNIQSFIENIVTEYKSNSPKENLFKTEAKEKEVIGVCPRCHKNVYESEKAFYCEGFKDEPKCTFSLWKGDKFFRARGKKITKTIAKHLLKDGKAVIKKLKSKAGNEYDATFIIKDNGKFINFEMEFLNKK